MGGFPAHASKQRSKLATPMRLAAYPALADWAVQALVRAKAARLEAGYLLDA